MLLVAMIVAAFQSRPPGEHWRWTTDGKGAVITCPICGEESICSSKRAVLILRDGKDGEKNFGGFFCHACNTELTSVVTSTTFWMNIKRRLQELKAANESHRAFEESLREVEGETPLKSSEKTH
jgi:hypothetical protein